VLSFLWQAGTTLSALLGATTTEEVAAAVTAVALTGLESEGLNGSH